MHHRRTSVCTGAHVQPALQHKPVTGWRAHAAGEKRNCEKPYKALHLESLTVLPRGRGGGWTLITL